jgi:hypothetical protein
VIKDPSVDAGLLAAVATIDARLLSGVRTGNANINAAGEQPVVL